jgi:AcrR family transcriptional regulator
MDKEKRQEIIRKVMGLYLQFGIRSVTMDDVVREVGISKKTLYQYFTDKSELVAAVVDCESNLNNQQHNEAIEGASNAIEKMLRFYHFQMKMIKDSNPSMIYDLKKYYPEVHAKFVEKKRDIIYKNVLSNLIQGKSEGLYREELNEEVIAILNLMRVEAFINTSLYKPEEILTKEFFTEMFTYHMYGIVSDKGRKILEENIDKLK